MSKKLSVVIITKNEEENIRYCLESVKWADEIIIVDGYSKDRTIEICEEYTDKIFQYEQSNFAEAKNYGIEKSSGEWILSIDADEIVTYELQKEILKLISNNENNLVGYFIPRKNYFLGKWIKYCGWYPDFQLRLFKKDKGKFIKREVHERLRIEGNSGFLKSNILHHTYKSIFDYFYRFNRYTYLEANEMIKNGKKFRSYKVLFYPIALFIYMYFLRRGFMDGMHGFLLSVFSSFYEFIKYVKLWELEKKQYN